MKRKSRKDLEIIISALEQKIASYNVLFGMYVSYKGDSEGFQEYLKDKYGAGSEDAVHHYEITQTSGPTSSRDYSHMVECNSDETNPSIISNIDYEQRKQD